MSGTLDAVIRVSRVNGRKGPTFLSPGEQRDAIRDWADRAGVTIGEWHDEMDQSGRTTDRTGLRAAADRALAGHTGGIVVAKLDRFSRNLASGLTTLSELEAKGLRFVAVREGIDSRDREDASSRLMLNILLSIAQWQLDALTEQWLSVRQANIRDGVASQEPFGYRRGPDRRLTPVGEEADAIRTIFRARADGQSWTALADTLNGLGLSPRRGRRFTFSRVKSIVENDVYLGILRSGDMVNREAHPPIVDLSLWEAANAQRRTPAKRDSEPYLLAGLVRCPACGVRMAGMTHRKTLVDGVKDYRYYRCRRSHSFGVCPAPASFRAEELEAFAEDWFRERYLAHRNINQVPVVSDELAAAAAALADAEAAMSNYLAHAKALRADHYALGLATHQADLTEAEERFAAVERAQAGSSLPPDLSDRWDDLSTEVRRGFLSDGLAALTVLDGEPVAWAVNDSNLPVLPGAGGLAAITPLDAP